MVNEERTNTRKGTSFDLIITIYDIEPKKNQRNSLLFKNIYIIYYLINILIYLS